ncbi:hypothetical protein D3C75_1072350 [compost metagenome]
MIRSFESCTKWILPWSERRFFVAISILSNRVPASPVSRGQIRVNEISSGIQDANFDSLTGHAHLPGLIRPNLGKGGNIKSRSIFR